VQRVPVFRAFGYGRHVYRDVGTEAQNATAAETGHGPGDRCLGLTEPCAGSDLKGIPVSRHTRADGYVINGQKIYLSNGQLW